jgi:hypothetical protein
MLSDKLCKLYLSRFWKVVGLERGPLSLVSTIEVLLGRKSSGSSLENRDHGRRDPSRWPRDTHYPQKLALTSLTSGGRLVGLVHSWSKATEFVCLVISLSHCDNFSRTSTDGSIMFKTVPSAEYSSVLGMEAVLVPANWPMQCHILTILLRCCHSVNLLHCMIQTLPDGTWSTFVERTMPVILQNQL